MMSKKILSEIEQIKQILSQLVGTSDLEGTERFSKQALNKASKQFKKLGIERGEWIAESDISKVIRGAPYKAGTFIREQFKFSHYFKRGSSHFYNRKSLVELNNALKERKVNLKRYMEYVEDKEKFEKYLLKAKENKKLGKLVFQLPEDANEIDTSPAKPPAIEVVNKHIKELRDVYKEDNLADYIDVYRNNYAMMKDIYFFGHYIEPGLKKKCEKWCRDFNHANRAIEEIFQNPV